MRRIIREKVELFIQYTADDPDVPPDIEEVMIDDVPYKLDGTSGLSEHIREIAEKDAYDNLTPYPSKEEMLNYRQSR